MSANINIRSMDGVTLLEVSGKIVLGEGAVVFRDAFEKALNRGARKIVIDLGGVNFMDSCGLGELTHAYTSAQDKGCDVKLAGLTTRLDNLMMITKLATVFDVYPDKVAAISAFSNWAPALG